MSDTVTYDGKSYTFGRMGDTTEVYIQDGNIIDGNIYITNNKDNCYLRYESSVSVDGFSYIDLSSCEISSTSESVFISGNKIYFSDDASLTTISSYFNANDENGFEFNINWIDGSIKGIIVENDVVSLLNEKIGAFDVDYTLSITSSSKITLNFLDRTISTIPVFFKNNTTNLLFATQRTSSSLIYDDISLFKESLEELQDKINTLTTQNWVNLLYKVGDIFISENDENPGERFGGTWELVEDRFLLGFGTNYSTIGDTGGTSSETLTVNQIPSHNHTFNSTASTTAGSGYVSTNTLVSGGTLNNVNSTGGGEEHNNMPPYQVVYIWKKISDEADPDNGFVTPTTTIYRYIETNSSTALPETGDELFKETSGVYSVKLTANSIEGGYDIISNIMNSDNVFEANSAGVYELNTNSFAKSSKVSWTCFTGVEKISFDLIVDWENKKFKITTDDLDNIDNSILYPNSDYIFKWVSFDDTSSFEIRSSSYLTFQNSKIITLPSIAKNTEKASITVEDCFIEKFFV